MMKAIYLALALVWTTFSLQAKGTHVQVQKTEDGYTLVVDGEDFMIKGMNWDYYPIGTNYTYSLWLQQDKTIKTVLDYEMPFLRDMGVNTLRIYTGIPKKWIIYIYEKYGIYTILNHTFGRYGLNINDEWIANIDYGDSRVRDVLIKQTSELAKEYKDTPGLLLFLLGNENNYGLFEGSTEASEIQESRESRFLENRGMYKLFLLSKESKEEQSQRKEAKGKSSLDQKIAKKAIDMYSLFNEAAIAMKYRDTHHPVAICNGDIMFIETISKTCPDIDIFGTNMYRGISFGDSFRRVAEELKKPILFTEFGADAYNQITEKEDEESQAYYLMLNWKEIYSNAAGVGGSKNAIGGITYQFSDGWWKYTQTQNLDKHDKIATWNNGGYYRDDENGANNMNEEWFGICSKIRSDAQGSYQLIPRAAYFLLKDVHRFSPYNSSTTLVDLENFFTSINLEKAIKESQ